MSQIIWSEFCHGCLCSENSIYNSNIWVQLIKVFDPLIFLCGWCRWQCLKTIIFFRNVTLSLSLVARFDEVPLRSVSGCSRHSNKYTKENKQRAKTGGCSIIKGAWLPEGISCSYLPLCLSLNVLGPPAGRRFFTRLQLCVTGPSVITWSKQEHHSWKQTCR